MIDITTIAATLGTTPSSLAIAETDGRTYYIIDGEAPIPAEVTARQLCRALFARGVSPTDVESAISEIEDPDERTLALIDWHRATVFERLHPLVCSVGAILELTPQDINEVFVEAAQI